MQGKLELNLEPPFVGFASSNQRRVFRYCQVDEIMNILIDLNLVSRNQKAPFKECVVSIDGDFPAEVLEKHGLVRQVRLKRQAS